MKTEQHTETKKKLWLAAIKIFAEKGYKETTVRDICKLAGSGNINSINYYFGSKEDLYTQILEEIFSHYDKFDIGEWEKKTAEQQLRTMIFNFCSILYKNNAFTSDITSIFISEMTRPSAFLEEMVDIYNRPRVKRHLKMFQDLLGEAGTEDNARNCLVSVAGQLLYYSFAWPVFSRLFPDYSPNENLEQWAEHVFEFSLAGIEAIKQQTVAQLDEEK